MCIRDRFSPSPHIDEVNVEESPSGGASISLKPASFHDVHSAGVKRSLVATPRHIREPGVPTGIGGGDGGGGDGGGGGNGGGGDGDVDGGGDGEADGGGGSGDAEGGFGGGDGGLGHDGRPGGA